MSQLAEKNHRVNHTVLETILTLRVVVGYLGEGGHFGWWPSAFFSSASRVFLAPVFTKTQLLAQCTGVTAAAALVHDERIGVGNVHHLFRLPEDMEQKIHHALQAPEFGSSIGALIASRETALAYLDGMAHSLPIASIGPTVIGDIQALDSPKEWATVAACYLHGFRGGVAIYPYFSVSIS